MKRIGLEPVPELKQWFNESVLNHSRELMINFCSMDE